MRGARQTRLVLCDDNRILCEALASILQARGHPVLAIATSATDSIAAVATNRPDACLLDLCFPDGSGLDIARAIRRSHPETKIVVLSCVTDPAVVSEAKKIGVVGFLRKDQKPETLAGALEVISAGRVASIQDARASQASAPCRHGKWTCSGSSRRVKDRCCNGSWRARALSRWPAR